VFVDIIVFLCWFGSGSVLSGHIEGGVPVVRTPQQQQQQQPAHRQSVH